MAIRVSETIYYVHDLDVAVEHYTERFGWRLIQKQDWGWAQLDIDGAAKVGLLTEAVWRDQGFQDEGLPRPRIGIQTDDIETEVARLRSAGAQVEPLTGEPGQMRATTFRDQDGNEFFLWDDGQTDWSNI